MHAAAVALVARDIPVVPGVHGEPKQLVAPAELYVPGTQSVHTPALFAADTVENVPAGQAVHAVFCGPVEYVPGRHEVHRFATYM